MAIPKRMMPWLILLWFNILLSQGESNIISFRFDGRFSGDAQLKFEVSTHNVRNGADATYSSILETLDNAQTFNPPSVTSSRNEIIGNITLIANKRPEIKFVRLNIESYVSDNISIVLSYDESTKCINIETNGVRDTTLCLEEQKLPAISKLLPLSPGPPPPPEKIPLYIHLFYNDNFSDIFKCPPVANSTDSIKVLRKDILKEINFPNKCSFCDIYRIPEKSYQILPTKYDVQLKKRLYRSIPGRLVYSAVGVAHFIILQSYVTKGEYSLSKGNLWIPLAPFFYIVAEGLYAGFIKKDLEYSFCDCVHPLLFWESTILLGADIIAHDPSQPQIDMFSSIHRQHPLPDPKPLPIK